MSLELTKQLMRYGERVQRSVFRLKVTTKQQEQLWATLIRICVESEDRLLMSQVAPSSWRAVGRMPDIEVDLLVAF